LVACLPTLRVKCFNLRYFTYTVVLGYFLLFISIIRIVAYFRWLIITCYTLNMNAVVFIFFYFLGLHILLYFHYFYYPFSVYTFHYLFSIVFLHLQWLSLILYTVQCTLRVKRLDIYSAFHWREYQNTTHLGRKLLHTLP